MPDRLILKILLCVIVAASASAPARARGATPEQIEQAIARAKAYIYSQQKDGHWENKPRDTADRGNHQEGAQWAGRTALATYALLAAGESSQDPRIKPAIDFLRKQEMVGVYALGLRCQVWYFLPQNNEVRALMSRDARALMNMINTPANTKKKHGVGHYGYVAGTGEYSHSRSQYGVLGIWAAALCDIEIPNRYWQVVEQAWMGNQDRSGGWSYVHPDEWPKHPITPGMTAAGVASLYIIQDYLYAHRGLDCKPSKPAPSDPAIEAGMKWLAANVRKLTQKGSYGDRTFPIVSLYAVERIGVASGRKYIGDVDWYEMGADWLVSVQQKNGSFPSDHGAVGDLPSSCFALLFLSRGGAPILMNKLEYVSEGEKQPSWNNRPRDLANMARWVGRQSEREYNWQVVGFQTKPADWHDAPILYVSGSEAINLKSEDRQKLKRYVEQGGLILGHADCSSRAFSDSFRKLGSELFPDYEFRVLPDDHLIYNNRYVRSRWRSKPQVLGMSNGVREIMLLIAGGDPGRDWQVMATSGKESSWELASNIYHYAVEGATRRMRGVTHWIEKAPAIQPTQTLAVARLQTAGNWNPEPGGWERLAAYLNNRYKVGLETKPVKLGDPIENVKVAHLTGTEDLRVEAAELAALKKFIEGGGTLVIDAAGGSSTFATAAERLIGELLPGQQLEAIPPDHALFNAGGESSIPIAYRSHTRKVLGSMPREARLKGVKVGDRWGVIYSREDLSAGLVGQEVDGIAGYTPPAAMRLMTQILFHATGTKATVVPPPKPAPAKN